MLRHNPRVNELIDMADPAPKVDETITFRYAWPAGPSLDYPLQAHFFENLGLPVPDRFDADYYITDDERRDAGEYLFLANKWAYRYCALTPRVGWPGKAWNDAGWSAIIDRLLDAGWTPVIFAGHPLSGPPWSKCLNLSGRLNIRQTAPILARCQAMLGTEGGLTNLRFALRKPAVVLTCATQFGVQVWAPPELCTEYRNPQMCEPCMWRNGHAQAAGHYAGPPGDTAGCPRGKSLRDLAGNDVWSILATHLEATAGGSDARAEAHGDSC